MNIQTGGPAGADNPGKEEARDAEVAKDDMGELDLPGPGGGKPEISHGFELLREEQVSELRATARLYRHLKSGAELLSIECDDENKTFAAMFRTPPPDASGLTHILEHSVLEGSESYPLKDLFKQLSKSSLKTYLNASTGSDRTYYPAASQNERDFENLTRVYLDAVFHPRLTRETFLQEGWHYETGDRGSPLEYKGVVFNEMKGASSSPDRAIFVACKSALFPDTPYSHDAGGDPRAIPGLRYDVFKRYHETYYHPSNALLFFYGNDNPERRLALADEALSSFDARQVDSTLPLQAPFEAPRSVVVPYAAEEGDLSRKAFVTESWAFPELTDPETIMAMEILDHILTSDSAAPLHKALIESGLGEGIAAYGLRGGQRQLSFSTGLKGTSKDSADAIGGVIQGCLEQLARGGIDADLVQASINSYEFALRECDGRGNPRGLVHLQHVMSRWMYDRDPIEALRYEAPLASIKARVASGERLFEDLIERYFLDNKHRARVVLEPDAQLQKRRQDEERAELAAAEASLTQDDVDRIRAECSALKEYQETPDTAEALASLPRLAVADLDKLHKPLPVALEKRKNVDVLVHDLFTNGIAYVKVGLNLDSLGPELLPYVPLFAACLRRMDTEKGDYVQLARRIGTHTGGIEADCDAFAVLGSSEPGAWLFLEGKAMAGKGPEMLSLMQEMLFSGKLDNQSSFLEVVKERKAELESSLIPDGSAVVRARLDAHFNPAGRVSEQMSGIDQIEFLKSLLERAASDWASVKADLEELRNGLLRREALTCDVTMEGTDWQALAPELDRFLERFPEKPVGTGARSLAEPPSGEGLAVASQVNYVGKAFNAYEHGYQYHGSIMAIRELIDSALLWDKVRVQGGAYGCRMTFDRATGVLSFVSYRDPNLAATLDVFDGAAEFLRSAPITREQIDQAVISAVGKLDPCLLPHEKGKVAFARHLRGIGDDALQQARDELFSTTIDDIRRFADVLDAFAKSGRVVVMGGKEALEGRPDLSVRSLS